LFKHLLTLEQNWPAAWMGQVAANSGDVEPIDALMSEIA
jgi:hypothetical protein